MPDVRDDFDAALHDLVSRARADTCVLAAVLLGSLAYDTVWRRSDIDLLLVVQEAPRQKEGLCLVERGINIHCVTATRSEFRKMLEGAVQGSFVHSLLGKGRMLFSRDEGLLHLFDTRHGLGERDRASQILNVLEWLLPGVMKARKWFHARKDYAYCSHWVLKSADALAAVEVLAHGEVPTREAIHQAMPLNPPLFQAVYTDLIEGPPLPATLGRALDAIDDYLRSHVDALFGPILLYLEEESEIRSMTDINHHFARHHSVQGVASACEWLADEGFLHKVASPARLTDRSRVEVEEAAYYRAGGQKT